MRSYWLGKCLIVSNHIIKSLAEFISNLLDLQLLSVDFIFNIVNPLVKLGDVHLSVFKSSLGSFELVLDAQNFVFQFLLSFHGLFCGHLQLLHVLTNHLEFFLNTLQFVFGKFCSFNRSFEFFFLDAKLSAQLVEFLFVVTSHLGSLSQILVKLLKSNLVVHALALNNLHFLQDIIGLFGRNSKLCDSVGKGDLSFLGLFLHQHDPTGQGRDVSLNLLVHFVLFLKAFISFVQFVSSLIKVNFKPMNFLSIISNITVSLVCQSIGLLGGIFKLLNDGIKSISFVLEGLHLLSDSIHDLFLCLSLSI